MPELQRLQVPLFRVQTEQLIPLASPLEFYLAVLRGIKESRQRITLSTLYLGNGQMERHLVTQLREASDRNPYLKVRVVLDYNRGMRRHRGESSMELLLEAKMKAKKPNNLDFVLYRHSYCPQMLDPLIHTGLPEVGGTYHSKACVFDDSVILTGANLSEEYFLTRKDRYLLVDRAPELADHLDDFFEVFADHGDRIGRERAVERAHLTSARRSTQARRSLDLFFLNSAEIARERRAAPTPAALDGAGPRRLTARSLPAESQSTLVAQFKASRSPLETLEVVSRAEELGAERQPSPSTGGSVHIAVAFQVPQMGLRQEEELFAKTMEILGAQPGRKSATLVSCYFNPTHTLRSSFAALPTEARLAFVAGSPRGSSFYRAGTFKKNIPLVYRESLYRWIQAFAAREDARFFEYFQEKTSFHVKGFWAEVENNEQRDYLTIIGSSNYSMRSFSRDLEGQFYIFTSDPEAIDKLDLDRQSVMHHAEETTAASLKRDPDTTPGLWSSLLYSLFKRFI